MVVWRAEKYEEEINQERGEELGRRGGRDFFNILLEAKARLRNF